MVVLRCLLPCPVGRRVSSRLELDHAQLFGVPGVRAIGATIAGIEVVSAGTHAGHASRCDRGADKRGPQLIGLLAGAS